MKGRRLGGPDATGESTDPVRFPETLKSRFADLRQAIDDLGRVLVQGAPGGFPPFDTLYERIVERFNSLSTYVDGLPVVNVRGWRILAAGGWLVVALFVAEKVIL